MRMWMLPPETMCRKHLLGEHVELHMLLGSLRRGKNIDGFLAGKLVDPRRMFRRHEELVLEMERRGYRHASPLDEAECETLARRYGRTGTGIDAGANAAELARSGARPMGSCTSQEEAERLLERLQEAGDRCFSPAGKPILAEITLDELRAKLR